MCIAILNYHGKVKKEYLKNSWDNNNHGAGILYSENGKLHTFKEMKKFEVFYSEYVAIRKRIDTPIVLHFRISTHGKIDLSNCHPFIVSEKLGFVHNGIIDIITENALYSDTWHFNELILKPLGDLIYSPAIADMITSYIGYSKLVFLNNHGEPFIFNEDLGHWNGDNWYSNNTYKETGYRDFGGKKVYNNTATTTKESGYNWWDENVDAACSTCKDFDCQNCKLFKY